MLAAIPAAINCWPKSISKLANPNTACENISLICIVPAIKPPIAMPIPAKAPSIAGPISTIMLNSLRPAFRFSANSLTAVLLWVTSSGLGPIAPPLAANGCKPVSAAPPPPPLIADGIKLVKPPNVLNALATLSL